MNEKFSFEKDTTVDNLKPPKIFRTKIEKSKLVALIHISLNSIAESRLVIIHFGNNLVSGIVIVMILALVLWRSQLEID